MSYSYILGDDYISLTNITTGNTTTMYSDNPRFEDFKQCIIGKDYVKAEELGSVKAALTKFLASSDDGRLTLMLADGTVQYARNGGEFQPFNNGMVGRIVRMAQDGFDCKPLVNFVNNLLNNPSKQSVDELYLFLEYNNLPITEDGCFIAYKIVRQDYLDIYSGKMSNKVGDVVEMPRNEVDDRRENTCSQGLHFCSKDYLEHYGSSNRDNDRCVLVKINPADVVSIPSDYNNAKGRTSKYVVVSEAPADWRSWLPKRDYTTASVVDEDGGEFDDEYEEDTFDDEMVEIGDQLNDAGFFFSLENKTWQDKFGSPVGRYDITHEANVDIQTLLTYEDWVLNNV